MSPALAGRFLTTAPPGKSPKPLNIKFLREFSWVLLKNLGYRKASFYLWYWRQGKHLIYTLSNSSVRFIFVCILYIGIEKMFMKETS